ncbi:MAG: PKD domain-containing protein, partial [Methanomicrobium sp.]|nr:PKD domain-containing protein [Methanomicrobium sp.]
MEYREDKIRQNLNSSNEDGIAEMMGALLLTVVIAAAVGILAVVILSGFSSAETPALRAGLSDEGGDVWLNHLGGNTLYRQTTLIMVNGVNRTSDFKTPEGDAWSTFSAGDSLASSVPYASGTEIMIIYTASENPTVIETLFCQPEIIVSPVADFTYTPTSGYSPMTVAFEDTSSGDPTLWSWDFGDGTTSPVQNPVHIYNSSGLYEVKLTVCNDGGCSSITKYITVFGFSDFVANESVFVYGNHLYIHNGNHVTGKNSTVIITGDLDMSGGVYLYVTNIFINGSVDLNNGATFGSEIAPGVSYITGNMAVSGNSNVYGDTYVEGNVVLGSSSSNIHGNLYTNGNLDFGTGDLYGETHVNGDFSITNTGHIHENVYV